MQRRSQLGVTLIEALVVISIILVLFSIAFPVFQNVKWNVKKSKSMSQMRQIHLAVLLYANDYAGDGGASLGLPPGLSTLKRVQKLPMDLFVTGGVPWKVPDSPPVYTWMPPRPDPREEPLVEPWKEHVANTDGNPVILIDETFNHEFGAFAMKSAFGIYYDGHIAHRRARGSLSEYSLWE